MLPSLPTATKTSCLSLTVITVQAAVIWNFKILSGGALPQKTSQHRCLSALDSLRGAVQSQETGAGLRSTFAWFVKK